MTATQRKLDTKKRMQRILPGWRKSHPDAKLDLDFKNPLELLIALILAAQARDDLVNKITPQLFQSHRTAADYAAATPAKLESRDRQNQLLPEQSQIDSQLRQATGGALRRQSPDNLDDLLSLPGVGRKTANIVFGNAFGQQTIGVDTHVMRLSQRLGLHQSRRPGQYRSGFDEIVPEKKRVRFCHLMQYHGRRICVAKKPKCPQCMINELCPFPAKTKF